MSLTRARIHETSISVLALLALATLSGCAGSAFPSNDAGLEKPATGGASTSGGETGGSQSMGGSSANGGESMTGGNVATGGNRAFGGSRATGGAAQTTGGAKSTGGSSATSAPSWTQLYTSYFAAGTPGDCASSGCHGGRQSPTFNSASSMCTAMKSYGIIGSGTASFNNLIKWFKQGGSMPQNNNPAPANAVADITAWTNAGAVCP